MNNNMMINPANYYNPFAKYNYISKTRGVYFPQDTQLLGANTDVKKSTNIYSENYDAEADLLESMNKMSDSKNDNIGILGFINKMFNADNVDE